MRSGIAEGPRQNRARSERHLARALSVRGHDGLRAVVVALVRCGPFALEGEVCGSVQP